VGSGELDGDQTNTRVHKSLPRFGPPEGNNLCPACLTLLQWCFTARCVQWRCRLDLAKVMSSQGSERSGGGDKKCLEWTLDLPPNLLYAEVGSQDYSPSRYR
jgi:hypothetical protein